MESGGRCVERVFDPNCSSPATLHSPPATLYHPFMSGRIAIIGAGLAGLAAAQGLAGRGFDVQLLESRGRIGGRASSFADSASGQLIDACQHVSMGCCTNLAHFCRTAGIDHLIEPQQTLYFMTPDGRISPFGPDFLPAPLHLARSFLRAHYLTWTDKLRIAWGLACLGMTRPRPDFDPPFLNWLEAHGQTQAAIGRFWSVVLVSALNEEPARVGLRHARKVFVEGFLRHRRACVVEVPRVPLGRLYGDELLGSLGRQGVSVELGQRVRSLHVEHGRVTGLEMRCGDRLVADWYISAVPFDRLLEMLPQEVVEAEGYFSQLRQLEVSPITSVHLWYDRPIMPLPHVVLLDSIGHWVFSRGEVVPGEHYFQVVISAARTFRGMGHDEVSRRVVEELGRLFPGPAKLLRSRVVTEHSATFSAVPGVDRLRPAQESPFGNLFVAGDWTRTGWPATMEGAVRSGYLAAEGVLARMGRRVRLLQPDLWRDEG